MLAFFALGVALLMAGLTGYGLRSRTREQGALADPVNARSARRSRAIRRRFNAARWAGLVVAAVGAGLLAIFVMNEMLR